MEYVIFPLELLIRLSCGLHFLPVHIGKDLVICSSRGSCGGIFDLCFPFIPLFALLLLLFAVIKLLVLLVALISMPCVFLIGGGRALRWRGVLILPLVLPGVYTSHGEGMLESQEIVWVSLDGGRNALLVVLI